MLVFSKGELITPQFAGILTPPGIQQLHDRLQQALLSSNNFKVKYKLLVLVKHVILLMGNSLLSEQALLARTLLEVLSPFMNLYRDSKLQYYAVLNIGLLLQQLDPPGSPHSLQFIE